RDLRWMGRARAQVGPFLDAHVVPPAKFLDDDGAPQPSLFSLLVTELDTPTAEFVEAIQRVDEVSVKGVAPHLAIGDDVDSGQCLRFDCLVNGPVLEPLEVRSGDL